MDIKINRINCILLLISGLVFHNFLTNPSIKVGPITITYLRVILLITIPILIYTKFKILLHDRIAVIISVFLIYFLLRVGSNFKEGFALLCSLLAFYFLYISIDNRHLIRTCVNLIATLVMCFSLVGIFELISGHHFVGSSWDSLSSGVSNSAVGMYFNPNDFSAFLTVGFFYILLSNYSRVIKYVFSFICLFIIYINNSQICLLGLLSFLLFAFVVKSKGQRFIRLVVSIVLVLSLLSPLIKIIKSSSLIYRAYMYKYGLKNCLAHIWFGTGVGNYAKGMYDVGFFSIPNTSADPHNVFLEISGTFGVVWLVLFLFFVIKMLIWFLKHIKGYHELICLGMVYIVPFVGLASSTCLEKNYLYLSLLIPALYYRFHCIYDRKIVFGSLI